MELKLREATISDVEVCGKICHEAFSSIAAEHNFPSDFPSLENGIRAISTVISSGGFHGVVAEVSGRVIGSNFLDERNPIAGIGPISVDPAVQNHGAGRQLMLAVMDRAERGRFAGVRLVQAGYHCRSLSLYLKLGFDTREHLSCMQGPPIGETFAGYKVRPARGEDGTACKRLCFSVHGHHRDGELRAAISRGSAMVVERAGRITAYTTQIAFFGHAVAETNDDLKALIAAAKSFEGAGFLVPTGNGELMRWCLAKGLRVIQPLTLMTIGLYNEPTGAYLPSILY